MVIESTVVMVSKYVPAAVEESIFNNPVMVSIVIPATAESIENWMFPIPPDLAEVPPVVVS